MEPQVIRYFEIIAHTKTGKYVPELENNYMINGAWLNEIRQNIDSFITWPQSEQIRYKNEIKEKMPELEIKFKYEF